MQHLYIILSTSATTLGLLITTATFLSKAVKNGKAKRAAERILLVTESLMPYIQRAEEFINFSGKEKKEYVLTKANQFAIERKIPFNFEAVSNKIEELVALTKNVNANKSPIESPIPMFFGGVH